MTPEPVCPRRKIDPPADFELDLFAADISSGWNENLWSVMDSGGDNHFLCLDKNQATRKTSCQH